MEEEVGLDHITEITEGAAQSRFQAMIFNMTIYVLMQHDILKKLLY